MGGIAYAEFIRNRDKKSEKIKQRRLLETYLRIVVFTGQSFRGSLLDCGCGNNAFVEVAEEVTQVKGKGIDRDTVNFETDSFPFQEECFDIVSANALIEHISRGEHFFQEVRRVLKPGGLFLCTTPNWELSYKTFYNDPTHVSPYTRKGLTTRLQSTGFEVLFLEPHYIGKPFWCFKLPLRWSVPLWTRSMICVARKKTAEG